MSLDLSASFAKLDRANEHLDSLKADAAVAAQERHPYSLGGEINPQTGWATLVMRDNKVLEPRLGTIVGDLVHNLRSALDCIVTALVDQSDIALTSSHQFPIYDEPAEFAKHVWRPGEVVGRGCLRGVTAGLAIIEPLQPYHTEPDHGADPLLQLHRFSNADKHREISGYYPVIEPGDVEIRTEAGAGPLAEYLPVSQPTWENNEAVVAMLRFEPPFPTKVNAHTEMTMRPLFSVRAFGKHPKAVALDVGNFQVMSEHVRMIADLFKSI